MLSLIKFKVCIRRQVLVSRLLTYYRATTDSLYQAETCADV